MARVLAIMSGKGGVGKTTTAINLGVALAGFGHRPIVVDSAFQSPHVGVHLGTPNPRHSIHEVMKGEKRAKHAMYLHPSGMQVLPGDPALDRLEDVDPKQLGKVLNELHIEGNIIILDTSPGFTEETEEVIRHAEEIYIVTTPELPSMSDAIRLLRLMERANKKPRGIILNRVRNDSVEMTRKNVETLLGVPVIGVIPEDDAVRKALHLRQPVAHTHPASKATVGFKQVAAFLLGEQYVASLEKEQESSMLTHTLKRLGLG